MTISEEKKKRILNSATELFSRYGYAKTSLEEIAKKVYIAKTTIYHYYSSKEELFIAAIKATGEEFFATLHSEIDSAETFEDKLSCFLRLPMKYIFVNMPILSEALRQIPQTYQARLEESRIEYRNRMSALLEEIMNFGKAEGIINEKIDSGRFSEIINDWFMMGDSCFDLSDKDRIIQRIERDHELIIQLLLYGVVIRRIK